MAVLPRNNLATNSAPWGRWVEDNIIGINEALGRNNKDQLNNNKQLNTSINVISDQIAKAPLGVTQTATLTGVSPATQTLAVYKDITFNVPANKNTASVFVMANSQFIDTGSGGSAFTSSAVDIILSSSTGTVGQTSVTSPTFRSAKDSGASAVLNVMTVSYGGTFSLGFYDRITVRLLVSASNPSVFPPNQPSNVASITANITYTYQNS